MVVLFLVFTYFELLSDIVRKKIPLLTQMEYLLNFVPSVLYQITPLAVLLTVLVMFGLMQKSNEITAMKATGVSIYRDRGSHPDYCHARWPRGSLCWTNGICLTPTNALRPCAT